MQNVVSTWQNAVVEITRLLVPVLTAIIPAIFTIVATIFTLRHQRKIEAVKIDGQAKLRARELMFTAYQQQMEKNAEDVRLLGQKVGELSMAAQLSDDEKEVKKAIIAFVGFIVSITNPIRGSLDNIQAELRHFNLLEARKEQITKLNEYINFDLNKKTPDLIFKECEKITLALGMIAALHQEILDCKRRELFKDYLPEEVQKSPPIAATR